MPDSKGNKEADAGSRLFSKVLFGAASCWNCSSAGREGLCTHMYNENVQQKPFCAAFCVSLEDLPISPRFSPTMFYRDAISVLLRTHLCTAMGSMRRTLCSKLFIWRALRSLQWECSAEPLRSILCHSGYSHLFPVVTHDFVSPGKFSTLQRPIFDTLQPRN